MPQPRQVTVVTPVPSPYQVELFNALASEPQLRLHVVYLLRRHADRLWETPEIHHPHEYYGDYHESSTNDKRMMDEADLVVFSYYAHCAVQRLMQCRVKTGRPWVYWGERPGFSGLSWLGRLRRRIVLASLHHSLAPIWGMGRWAVEAWQREFGPQRFYQNIPYFSNLERFAVGRHVPVPSVRRFLFSGALIRRKGIDLLAEAFATVAASRRNIRLEIVGSGGLESAVKSRLACCAAQVHFHGFQQWRDLPAHYQQAEILVAPSRYDGWGLIVPEGLAAGLPVISTDRTGAALEFIEHRTNGWIVPAGNVRSLSLAIAEAADLSDERLEEMSAAASASVAEHSLSKGAERFQVAASAALAAANHI